MVSFYYAQEFLPFIIDTVIYASILVILINIVMKTPSSDEEKKRVFYSRLLAALLGGPFLTIFLYSAFGFNLGKLFTKAGAWVIAGIVVLIILVSVFVFAFKKKHSLKGVGWLWWVIPLLLIPISTLIFAGEVRDFIILFSIFFILFVTLVWAVRKGASPSGGIKDELKKIDEELNKEGISDAEKARLLARKQSLLEKEAKEKSKGSVNFSNALKRARTFLAETTSKVNENLASIDLSPKDPAKELKNVKDIEVKLLGFLKDLEVHKAEFDSAKARLTNELRQSFGSDISQTDDAFGRLKNSI
ncbi:hypothetical protein DRJ22_02475, partial [Candidatus Woesearchaeota archaeon]